MGTNPLRVSLLVIWSQFSDSDGDPVSIVELRVDADPLPPRPAAEQHHLADTRGDCNRHSAGPVSTETRRGNKEIKAGLSLNTEKLGEGWMKYLFICV